MHKVENTGLNGDKKKLGFFTWQWMCGFVLLAIGSIINVSVLPFIDLVVVSTIASVGILINYGLALIFLGEKIVWRYDLPAIILILGGSLTIIWLSDYSETVYTPDLIRELLWSTTTLVSALIALLFTVLTCVEYCWHKKQIYKFNTKLNQFLYTKLTDTKSTSDDNRG